ADDGRARGGGDGRPGWPGRGGGLPVGLALHGAAVVGRGRDGLHGSGRDQRPGRGGAGGGGCGGAAGGGGGARGRGCGGRRRREFEVPLAAPAEAVARALAAAEGPIVLVDSADSVSSGSTGDSTALLRALQEAGPGRHALVTLVDPAGARAAAQADGAQVTL